MTRYEFLALCGENLVDPDLVLDTYFDEINDALRAGDDTEVARIIREGF